jgi:hypothetical protein
MPISVSVMPVSLVISAVMAVAGVACFAAMRWLDEPIFGVFGFTALCIAGVEAAAYGVAYTTPR